MITIRFRLIGNREDADTIIAGLHGMNGVDRIEEIDDLMPELRDDSSSNGPSSDNGARVYCVEVDVPTDTLADDVRGQAEVLAHDLDAGIEFLDEF